MNTIDTKMMKALAHPLRQKILLVLNDRVASPSEIAEELDEPLGNVSYHVRMLVDLGAIELIGTTPRRGALEHHYKAKVAANIQPDAWKSLPGSVRTSLAGDLLTQIGEEASLAVENGGLSAASHITRTPLVLDEKGQGELDALLAKTLDRALAISAASQKRLKDDEGDQQTLSVLSFRSAP